MDQAVSRFDADAHAAEIRQRGYTVIRDFMDADTIAGFREGLAPFVGRRHGRNDFEGFKTERVYTWSPGGASSRTSPRTPACWRSSTGSCSPATC